MSIAWLITVIAVAGIAVGVAGHVRVASASLAACGGGLLVGICAFWLIPELVPLLGWVRTLLLVFGVSALFWLFDRALGHKFLAPLLAATALHSFLDGWALRTLSIQPWESIAVPVGLSLHKFPEGLALGWLVRKRIARAVTAVSAASLAELMTPLGAWIQPYANRGGVAQFGPSWTAVVLTIVGATFLFLGLHAIVPERKNARVILLFSGTFAVVGCIALLHPASGAL